VKATFAEALARAGWSADDYEAHVAALVELAPPLPRQVVDLLSTQRPRQNEDSENIDN
jgi:hypothetical protein